MSHGPGSAGISPLRRAVGSGSVKSCPHNVRRAVGLFDRDICDGCQVEPRKEVSKSLTTSATDVVAQERWQ